MINNLYSKVEAYAVEPVSAIVFSSAGLAAATVSNFLEGAEQWLSSSSSVSLGVSVVQIQATRLAVRNTNGAWISVIATASAIKHTVNGILKELSLGKELSTLFYSHIASASVAALATQLASSTFSALKISNTKQKQIGAGVALTTVAYFSTTLPLSATPLLSAAFTLFPLYRWPKK